MADKMVCFATPAPPASILDRAEKEDRGLPPMQNEAPPVSRSAGVQALVANGGGHLRELTELRARLPLSNPVWLTFDGEQSRSLLAGERVTHLHWTGSRDYRNTARNVSLALRFMRQHDVTDVFSTGAAVALSVFPVARAHGLACHYVESAARTAGPSMTGRLLRAVPGVHLYTQHPAWADRRWRFAGSVFDGFSPGPTEPVKIRRVVVTLGTMRQYSFRAAVERLLQVLPPDAEVVWQTGFTDVSGLAMNATPMLSSSELAAHMRDADLVVAHAGVGSSLDALAAGRRPLLLPRRASRGEHVDDHQAAVADDLVRRGLAVVAEAPDLTPADLAAAADQRAMPVEAPPFRLL